MYFFFSEKVKYWILFKNRHDLISKVLESEENHIDMILKCEPTFNVWENVICIFYNDMKEKYQL